MRERQKSRAAGPVRTLAQDEILIRKNEPKTHLYRVESGVLCLYDPDWNGHQAIIEFAYPGDLVGLGFLDHHTLSARAMIDTQVTCLPLEAMDDLAKGDAAAAERLAQAIEREFAQRKEALIAAGRERPVERVAALLVSVARTHAQEGRDPRVITETWPCAVVADYLQMSVDDLAVALADLKARGLIEPGLPDGIRVKDLAALEELAVGMSKAGPVDEAGAEDLGGEQRPAPRVYRKAITSRLQPEAGQGSERGPRPGPASRPRACGRSA